MLWYPLRIQFSLGEKTLRSFSIDNCQILSRLYPRVSIESPFMNFPEIQTERLSLRMVKYSDAEDLFEIKSDGDLTAMYAVEPHESIRRTQRWIELIMKGYKDRNALFWCITLKGDDTPIGTFTLWNIDLGSFRAELGYELHRSYWRKGIMFEALTAAIRWAFKEMGLNRIEACPLEKNTPSREILLKLGFNYEGNLRERFCFKGVFEDQHYYSLLRKEWEGQESGRQSSKLS